MALEFVVGIEDKASGPAKSAASGMLSAADAATILTGKIKAVDAAMLVASATGARSSAIEKLKVQQAGLTAALERVTPAANADKAAMESAAAAELRFAAAGVAAGKAIAAALKEEEAASARAAVAFKKAAAEKKEAAEGVADLATKASEADAAIASGGLTAAAGAIAAVGAAAYEAIGGVEALAAKSLEATEKVELLGAQLEALSNGSASGKQVIAVLDDVAAATGQARDEVGRLARKFEGVGITDLAVLRESLLAAKTSATIAADGSSRAFESLTEKIATAAENGDKLKIATRGLKSIAETGVRADEVAAKLGITTAVLDARLKAGTQSASQFGRALNEALIDKGAPALEVAGRSVDAFKARVGNAIEKLFEGVNTRPLTDELQKVPALFDASSASGQAMAFILTHAMDAVFEAAAKVVPILRHGLILALIAVLEVMDFVDNHATIVKGALLGLALAAASVAAPFVAIGVAIGVAVTAIVAWFAAVGIAIAYLAQLGPKAVAAGEAFIEGLVTGIRNGAVKVADAASDAAHAAVAAVKGALGIHSPSTVMIDVGANTAKGMAIGLRSGKEDVAEASRGLAKSPMANAAPSSGGASGPGGSEGGGGDTVNHFHFAPGSLAVHGGGKDAESITEELVALIFERIAAQQGLGTGATS